MNRTQPKKGRTGQPAAPKAEHADPSAKQMDLGKGWNHVVRGGCVKATTTPPTKPHPKLPPQSVTEAPEKPVVTATRETGRPQNPELKCTAAPKRPSGKSKKKAATSVKTAAATTTTPNLVVPTQISTSQLQEISDLLDHFPSMYVRSCLVGSSRTSLPSPQGQLALALS